VTIPPEHALTRADLPASGTAAIVLGSAGGPDAWTRNGPAVAIWSHGAVYLVDFGLGVLRQFRRAGLDYRKLRAGFVTHLHSDHIAELFMFFASSHYHSRHAIELIGPGGAGPSNLPLTDRPLVNPLDPAPGLASTVRLLARGFAYDQNIRIGDEGAPDLFGATGDEPVVRVRELPLPDGGSAATPDPAGEPVLAYEDDRVRVLALPVRHPPIFPCYALRFETPDGSVTISGDTAPCANVEAIARDTDLLIHEALHVDGILEHLARTGAPAELLEHMLKAHTADRTIEVEGRLLEGVGRVARRAGARELVLTHLVPAVDMDASGSYFELDDDAWLAGPRAEFGGPVRVARELEVIPIRSPG